MPVVIRLDADGERDVEDRAHLLAAELGIQQRGRAASERRLKAASVQPQPHRQRLHASAQLHFLLWRGRAYDAAKARAVSRWLLRLRADGELLGSNIPQLIRIIDVFGISDRFIGPG
jgi:hypothetical protein